jgi:CSLREA domain-containing protein
VRGFAVTAGLLGALLALSAVAGAATFKPTRHDDPTPGPCKPKDCSLREAIIAANGDSAAKVVLGKGTYKLEIPPTDPDGTPEDGDLNISSGMQVLGKGPQRTKIDGDGVDRVFLITQISGHVLLRGLTVKGGDPYQHPNQTSTLGGGIWAYAFDTVKLVNVAIRHNNAQFGGGFRDQTPKVVLKKSTIASNTATQGGGGFNIPIGLFNPSVLQITSSTIQGNLAATGGGILADGSSMSPDDDEPDIRLTNSTVAGNMTSNEAAGLFADNGALMTLDNTTVAYNQANTDDVGVAVAAGIYQHSGSTVTVGDSIIASNTVGQGGSDPDCSGTFSGDGNVLGAGTGCGDFSPATNQFVGSALIGTLADNGGSTKTIALKPTSPALGYAETCPAKDQRGEKRPNNNCDSGSYERKGN